MSIESGVHTNFINLSTVLKLANYNQHDTDIY